MKKSAKLDPLAERPDLDFSKGVRGKYTNLLKQGTNIVILEADLHSRFPDSASVNRALRAFLVINDEVKSASRPMRPSRRPATPAAPELDRRAEVSSQRVTG